MTTDGARVDMYAGERSSSRLSAFPVSRRTRVMMSCARQERFAPISVLDRLLYGSRDLLTFSRRADTSPMSEEFVSFNSWFPASLPLFLAVVERKAFFLSTTSERCTERSAQ